MPTYEYACEACGHEWELEQSIKDAPLKDCSKCQAASAKRQISRGTGFILKGGGWYSDLYSGASNKKADAGASSKSDGGSTGSGGSGSDGGSSGSKGSSSGSAGSSSGSSGSSNASSSVAA